MDTYKVTFFVSVGNGQTLPGGMQVHSDRLQLMFHVPEKDMNAFTRVLRTNGIAHTILPDDPATMEPGETEVIYDMDDMGGEGDYDEDEFTD